MKVAIPGADVKIQTAAGNVDPTWYGKLKQIETLVNGGAIGQGALATNATSGFGFLPTCAGAPTGTPVGKTGYAPVVYDTTNNKLWIYSGAWRGVTLT